MTETTVDVSNGSRPPDEYEVPLDDLERALEDLDDTRDGISIAGEVVLMGDGWPDDDLMIARTDDANIDLSDDALGKHRLNLGDNSRYNRLSRDVIEERIAEVKTPELPREDGEVAAGIEQVEPDKFVVQPGSVEITLDQARELPRVAELVCRDDVGVQLEMEGGVWVHEGPYPDSLVGINNEPMESTSGVHCATVDVRLLREVAERMAADFDL